MEAFHDGTIALHRHRRHRGRAWSRPTPARAAPRPALTDVLRADAWARAEAARLASRCCRPRERCRPQSRERLVTGRRTLDAMSTLAFVLGVLVIAIGVGASIALHEIGHLVPAKRFGVRVTQYMVGFGPTIWSRRRGETEYGVKAIPLGGYIRMIGMFPPRPGDKPGTVRASSTGRFSQLVDEARAASLEEVRPGRRGPRLLPAARCPRRSSSCSAARS